MDSLSYWWLSCRQEIPVCWMCEEELHGLTDGTLELGIYRGLSAYKSTATLILASAFHQFGWVFAGVINRTNLRGNIRHGKRITGTIQATSAGRRRGGTNCSSPPSSR